MSLKLIHEHSCYLQTHALNENQCRIFLTFEVLELRKINAVLRESQNGEYKKSQMWQVPQNN